MADYDWFHNEPATDSDEKLLAETLDYSVTESDPQAGNLNQYARQMQAKVVICNWCMCLIHPAVFAMRQHRRVCATDPRVAGSENSSESIKDQINGIRK